MKKVLLILFFLHALGVVYLLHELGYRVNFTDSMPHGIYQIVPGKPGREDLITFSLAEDNPYFQISLERHYLGLNGNRPLLKTLAGLPGDSIEISAEGLCINSELLQHTQARSSDRYGRQLPIFLKSTVIPSAKGLALSTYTENSFDGRYFGLVDMDQVRRVLPILTFRLLKNSDLLRCCEKSKPSRMSNTFRPCILLAPCISPFLNSLFNLE
jgi:conjugative transfer signal peptidase TraF